MLERLDIPTSRNIMQNGRQQEVIPAGDAIAILRDMRESLDNAFVGEDAAKGAVINTLATQSSIALGGLAGAGKSTFVRGATRLVGLEYDSPAVAFVPGSPDLRAIEITGGRIDTKKKVTSVDENGSDVRSSNEDVSIEIEPIFNEDTEFGHFEELTAANIRAIRAAMSILGDKTLETNQGRLHLRKLIAVFASMNAAKRLHGTNPLPPQIMDRISFGAIMGQNHRHPEQRKAHNKEVAKRGSNPELNVKQVVDRDKLIKLGRYIRTITVDEAAEEKIHDVAISAADYLRTKHGVEETDHRIVKQLFTNAKAYGARNSNKVVDEQDIFDATRSTVSARIAPLLSGMEIDLDEEIRNITNL